MVDDVLTTPSAVSAAAARPIQSPASSAALEPLMPAFLVLTVVGLAASVAVVGADARWLAAMGGVIWSHHAIPAGVPFASAPSHWANALVLAQLLFHGLESALGDRGFMVAQLAAVAVATAMLTRDALAGGAKPRSVTAALLLTAVAVLPDLAVARVQLFSIALFPVAAALLRREARDPSRCIWLIVPLLALWSNLHGSAVIGLGMTLSYLALARVREDPRTAVAVAVAASLAICATPAGIHTLAYYHGVLTNVAAQRGQGLWAPLSLVAPLDLLLVAGAIALAIGLRRRRPQAWELVVLLVLAGLTIKASRSGVWLLFFLAPLAAGSFKPRDMWGRVLPALTTVALAGIVLAVARGPLPNGASREMVARAIALAHGRPILAEDLFSEQIASDGGRIWLGNPIDAFSTRDQATYLDWLQGSPRGRRAIGQSVDVILTGTNDPARRLMMRDRRFRLVLIDRNAALYARQPSTR